MPQCKKDGCREQAIYHRRWGNKRYCEAHGHAYADKRDKALALRAKMADCQSGISPSCFEKVWEGATVCRFCEEAARELRRIQEHEDKKWVAFHYASTVEELKAWIKEYMS